VFWFIVLVNISLAITYVTLGYQEVDKLKDDPKFATAFGTFGKTPAFNVFTALTILTPWLCFLVSCDA